MNALIETLAVILLILLAGCGVDWLPEPKSGTTNSTATVKSVDVGTYVASVRSGQGKFTVTTTKGAFDTYTSLAVPYKTAVTMETYTDSESGLLVGRMLTAANNSILVKAILALVE